MTSDKLQRRMEKRIGLFLRRGTVRENAAEIAETLQRRDAERDDRRMCIECAHLQRDGGCFAARQGWLPPHSSRSLTPVQDMLQRCGEFVWQKP
jgi:hypothetical protein